MNRIFFGLVGASSLFMLTAVHAGQAKPATAMAKPTAAVAKATPESIASGEKIFKRQCQTCHGATGVGDGPAAKTLKGKLPNLADKATFAKPSAPSVGMKYVVVNGAVVLDNGAYTGLRPGRVLRGPGYRAEANK